jgi:hypothetical protein
MGFGGGLRVGGPCVQATDVAYLAGVGEDAEVVVEEGDRHVRQGGVPRGVVAHHRLQHEDMTLFKGRPESNDSSMNRSRARWASARGARVETPCKVAHGGPVMHASTSLLNGLL